jgi:outer membrane protein assembly factor BamA
VLSQNELSGSKDSLCIQKDLKDVIRKARNKTNVIKEEKKVSLLLFPIIGSNPATGFMVGVGGQAAFKILQSSKYSAISGSIQFTTKNQFLFLVKNNIYTKSDRIFLSGDWRFLIYSQSTYGLGTNSPTGGALQYQYNLAGAETNNDSLIQPMTFDFLRVHQSVSFKIFPAFYLGVGYNLDAYFKIVDEKLRLNPGDTLQTSHYAYSQYYGFDTKKYFSSALNINVIYDTRDNMINPYKGCYARLSWNGAMEFLGSDKKGDFYQLEWRSFHKLSKKNPRHLMAFWLMGDFSPPGEFPYLILPATAYDQRSRSARGYTQGRFRGNNLVYGETEYRFPISACGGVLGGVLFLNATTASAAPQSVQLFEYIQPGYGFGLRVMVDKRSRTNLAIDIGFGDKSVGFYLAASETF